MQTYIGGVSMPVYLLKEVGSWSVAGGIWFGWLCSRQDEGEAIY
ncbi:hypothetical protein NC653_023523 [Populus alba x Populus x berolinensis]|uniref:Uncharacterized protein n=1 Tax=Populus alba x Populus x berolinensis TaxID=444605 RepID=A0AAD6QAS9_9ROSI|nr:hypothetical protein NC653_023523 [Populus alba x Populus x berolinensis]